MKCRNCGINYDDDDKECPICGTKAGQGNHIAAPKYTSYSHSTHSPKECTHETYTKAADFTRSQPPHPLTPLRKQAGSKSAAGKRSALAFSAIGVILTILLSILSAVPDLVRSISEELGVGTRTPDSSESMLYETEGSTMIDPAFLEGQWLSTYEDGSIVTIAIDSDGTYTLHWSAGEVDYAEGGQVWLWSESAAQYYTEEFPASRYDAYTLNLERFNLLPSGLSPEQLPASLAEEIERNLYLLLYLQRDTATEQFTLYDIIALGEPIFQPVPVPLIRVQAG